jgi:enterochelin esterase-like enzyme
VTHTPEASITPMPRLCEEDAGQIIDIRENLSAIANENLRYRVYVPPCYFALQKRFPLVIMLHGLSYREQQWEELGLLTALDAGLLNGTLAPMVIVMPYMGEIGQLNQFPPDPAYERVILEELLPAVQRNFCIWESPAYRAIGGIQHRDAPPGNFRQSWVTQWLFPQ